MGLKIKKNIPVRIDVESSSSRYDEIALKKIMGSLKGLSFEKAERTIVQSLHEIKKTLIV